MRTLLSSLLLGTLTLSALPALAEEMETDATVPATAEQNEPELTPDALCRKELKIADGLITRGYLLFNLRKCVTQKNRDIAAAKKAAMILQKTTPQASNAEMLRRQNVSRRTIRDQSALRQTGNKQLMEAKKNFVRFRRRQTVKVGTGSLQE